MGVEGRRRAWGWWVGLLGVIGGCSSAGLGTRESDTPQIGLQRGGRWSVLSVRPPHLSGPHFHFILRDGVLAGSISGATAPAGSIRVRITPDGAEGYGPLGPISMDFVTTQDSTVAEGMWNGHRVHLVFARDSVQGTVADNSTDNARADPEATQGMQMFRGRRRGGVTVNANLIDPLPANSSCEYFLNNVASDGALFGGSICSGMPQQTRLEVPEAVQSWLTKPELVTLLVAVLSSPPAVAAEDLGPRFVDPNESTQSRTRRR